MTSIVTSSPISGAAKRSADVYWLETDPLTRTVPPRSRPTRPDGGRSQPLRLPAPAGGPVRMVIGSLPSRLSTCAPSCARASSRSPWGRLPSDSA
ncbi:MAG: hypothetical protein A6D92_19820 [Symbiobacterium thermophilum]|uniref:Uncharacterized protein n=1 Tax=Symbiobacterium thermophilum TaxID=2734 RepID=A0A1Y2T3R4_SYMTR|nr:MAG: hypothetical protein A6D92_19820 [Symbiobacterium thermophilum]